MKCRCEYRLSEDRLDFLVQQVLEGKIGIDQAVLDGLPGFDTLAAPLATTEREP